MMIKRFDNKLTIWLLLTTVIGFSSGAAWAKAPTFSPAIWGDGELWATKGVASLPPPNQSNVQSYDRLFVVTNSNNPMGQLPVSEAAPRNFNFNGGRWFAHTVEWTQAGFNALGTVPVLKSYDDIAKLSGTKGDPRHKPFKEEPPAGGTT